MLITIDFETRSACDLKACGMYRYAEDPTTEVICLSVKIGAEQSRIWVPKKFQDLGQIDSQITNDELEEIITTATEIHAHNMGFERVIWHEIMHKKNRFSDLPLEKCYCTAAQAAAKALPRDLNGAGKALGLEIQKDKDGHSLMLKMCKPRKPRKAERLDNPDWEDTLYWHEEPEQIQRLVEYCLQDTDAEYEVHKALPPLPPVERQVWLLDQQINDRGVFVDIESIEAVISVVERHEAQLLERVAKLTDGDVSSVRQVAKTIEWLSKQGVQTENLQSQTVEKLLETVPEGPAKEMLEIRQQLGKSSVSKFKAMRNMRCSDGRVKGTLLYHGATTGRWTARGMQPQNLPQGSLTPEEVEDALFQFQFTGVEGNNVMEIASSCIRGCMTASPNSTLFCADFSNIEGRVAAWLAGEEWKIQAFKEFDNGTGEDLYKVAYGKAFGVSPKDVTKDQRQIGKTMELACGFQGGPKAFVGMAKNVGLSVDHSVLEALTPKETVKGKLVQKYVEPPKEYRCSQCGDQLTMVIDTQPWSKIFKCCRCLAEYTLTYFDKQSGCSEWGALCLVDTEIIDPTFSALTAKCQEEKLLEAWAKPLVTAWRDAHQNVAQMWYGLENAATDCVRYGGVREFKGIKFGLKDNFLCCKLPSGRLLSYYDPQLKKVKAPWGDEKEVVTFMGMDSFSHKWTRLKTYGGSLFQSCVQATARDIMAEAMLRLTKAGANIVLTVHDEILADNQSGDIESFMKLMAEPPVWAEGCPISVDGWSGERYRK